MDSIKNICFLLQKHNKSLKRFTNSELKVETYEIFRQFFNRTSSVNDMNVKKMNFKKVDELLYNLNASEQILKI